MGGTLVARGTPQQKIVFTSVDVPLTADGRYIDPDEPPDSLPVENYWGSVFFIVTSPRYFPPSKKESKQNRYMTIRVVG